MSSESLDSSLSYEARRAACAPLSAEERPLGLLLAPPLLPPKPPPLLLPSPPAAPLPLQPPSGDSARRGDRCRRAERDPLEPGMIGRGTYVRALYMPRDDDGDAEEPRAEIGRRGLRLLACGGSLRGERDEGQLMEVCCLKAPPPPIPPAIPPGIPPATPPGAHDSVGAAAMDRGVSMAMPDDPFMKLGEGC